MSEYILKIMENPNPKDPLGGPEEQNPDPVLKQFLREEMEKEQDYETWLEKHFVEVEWNKTHWVRSGGSGIWITKKKRRQHEK